MLRAQGTSAPLRRPPADQALALLTRWKTVGIDFQLAGLSNQWLSEDQIFAAEKISERSLGVNREEAVPPDASKACGELTSKRTKDTFQPYESVIFDSDCQE